MRRSISRDQSDQEYQQKEAQEEDEEGEEQRIKDPEGWKQRELEDGGEDDDSSSSSEGWQQFQQPDEFIGNENSPKLYMKV